MTTMTIDKHWTQLGPCRDDPQLFTPGSFRGAIPASVAYAVSICRRRCPVLDRCEEWRQTRTEADLSGQIVAGHYHE